MERRVVYGGLIGVSCFSQAMADDAFQVPEVVVIGVTPVLGTGVDLDKVPRNVQVINPSQQRNGAPNSVAEMLDHRLGSGSSSPSDLTPRLGNGRIPAIAPSHGLPRDEQFPPD